MARDMGEGEPWLLLAMFGHTSYYPLLLVNLLIFSIKMICTKRQDSFTIHRTSTGVKFACEFISNKCFEYKTTSNIIL